ncbi:hypothetical protein MUG84_13425 [Paenibacillus sp. KQZ6P-2]|uniref:Uncharacterized protein n=1 Tax=Paenibacillus mangrovi TaxID=2931978 RepID=A0A9X1WP07_9BACL|nr:hypothetical protein [Paenibacillus mangrovi]MCJ8012732.1 hypothetical protein [Paenibacillus mangrovi]
MEKKKRTYKKVLSAILAVSLFTTSSFGHTELWAAQDESNAATSFQQSSNGASHQKVKKEKKERNQ